MPPPPPSYIPLASAEAAYSQGASSPYIHYENANTYNETVAHINSQFPQQPSHEIPACNRPVNVSLTPTTESFHGQEQIHAREDSEVFVLNNETGRVVLVQNHPPEESYLHNVLPATAPVDDTRTQQDAPCEQTAVSAPIIMAPQAAKTKDEIAADRNPESSVSTGSVEQQMSRLNLGATPRPMAAEPEGRQKPKKIC